MNKNNRSSDFNLFNASDATLGVLEAIYEMLAEVPAEHSPERARWINGLTGLAWVGRNAARELNAFVYEASDLQRIPCTYSDIESDHFDGVKETAAIYSIR